MGVSPLARGALLLLAAAVAAFLATFFPGTAWGILIRAGILILALTLIGHLLLRLTVVGEEVDPPLTLQGGAIEVRLRLRASFFGTARLRCRAFGWEWEGPRAWVGPTPQAARLVFDDLPRGEHRVRIDVAYEDPLGLWTRKVASREVPIEVGPLTADVEPAALIARAAMVASGQRRREDAREPAGARPYHPGDRLGRVHWPLTARHGALQVRESWTRELTALPVVLDVRREAYRTEAAFETAVSVAGSLVLSARRRGARCSLTAGTERSLEGAETSEIAAILMQARLVSEAAPTLGGLWVTGGQGVGTASREDRLIIATEPGAVGGALRILSLEALVQAGRATRWAG